MDSNSGRGSLMRFDVENIGAFEFKVYSKDVRFSNDGVGGQISGRFKPSELPAGLMEHMSYDSAIAFCVLRTRWDAYQIAGDFRVTAFSAKLEATDVASFECTINSVPVKEIPYGI